MLSPCRWRSRRSVPPSASRHSSGWSAAIRPSPSPATRRSFMYWAWPTGWAPRGPEERPGGRAARRGKPAAAHSRGAQTETHERQVMDREAHYRQPVRFWLAGAATAAFAPIILLRDISVLKHAVQIRLRSHAGVRVPWTFAIMSRFPRISLLFLAFLEDPHLFAFICQRQCSLCSRHPAEIRVKHIIKSDL